MKPIIKKLMEASESLSDCHDRPAERTRGTAWEQACQRRYDELERQRDELLAALKLLTWEISWHTDLGFMQQKGMCAEHVRQANAAIARAEGRAG